MDNGIGISSGRRCACDVLGTSILETFSTVLYNTRRKRKSVQCHFAIALQFGEVVRFDSFTFYFFGYPFLRFNLVLNVPDEVSEEVHWSWKAFGRVNLNIRMYGPIWTTTSKSAVVVVTHVMCWVRQYWRTSERLSIIHK